jgi:two-component system response regulator HydG
LLADYFVDEFNTALGVHKQLGAACERELMGYDWPGNITELRGRLRHAHQAAGDVIETIYANQNGGMGNSGINGGSVQISVGTPLATVEELLIRATLDAVGGTRHRAASMLGISPKTLYNKLQRMKLA